MEYKNKPCRTGAWVFVYPGEWIYSAHPELYTLASETVSYETNLKLIGFRFYKIPPQLRP